MFLGGRISSAQRLRDDAQHAHCSAQSCPLVQKCYFTLKQRASWAWRFRIQHTTMHGKEDGTRMDYVNTAPNGSWSWQDPQLCVVQHVLREGCLSPSSTAVRRVLVGRVSEI